MSLPVLQKDLPRVWTCWLRDGAGSLCAVLFHLHPVHPQLHLNLRRVAAAPVPRPFSGGQPTDSVTPLPSLPWCRARVLWNLSAPWTCGPLPACGSGASLRPLPEPTTTLSVPQAWSKPSVTTPCGQPSASLPLWHVAPVHLVVADLRGGSAPGQQGPSFSICSQHATDGPCLCRGSHVWQSQPLTTGRLLENPASGSWIEAGLRPWAACDRLV